MRPASYEDTSILTYASNQARSLTTDSSTMSTTMPVFTNTLGPLPTAWALPASCTTGLAADNHEAWLHQSCVGSNFERNPSCWPPRTEGAASLSSALSTWGIYSPGTACPSGMTSACGFDGSMNTGAFQFYFPPGPSQTAIGCCPSLVPSSFMFDLSPIPPLWQ